MSEHDERINAYNAFEDPTATVVIPDLLLRTVNHPRAHGRTPAPGEEQWVLLFHLEDGRLLAVVGGAQDREQMRNYVLKEEANRVTQHLVPPEE